MKRNMWTALAMVCALASPMASMAAGAIAVDDHRGETDPGYGFSLGNGSREEAARDAMRQCRQNDNDDCKVVVRFDSCGAYATSSKYYGVGWGESRREAERMALADCGRSSCAVIIAKCE